MCGAFSAEVLSLLRTSSAPCGSSDAENAAAPVAGRGDFDLEAPDVADVDRRRSLPEFPRLLLRSARRVMSRDARPSTLLLSLAPLPSASPLLLPPPLRLRPRFPDRPSG